MALVLLNRDEVWKTASDTAFPLVDRVLDETLAGARRMVPVRQPRPHDRRATGRLKRSLRKRGPRRLMTKVAGSVGSTRPYALSVHTGAQAHTITARNRPNLVFYWQRENVTFVGRSVRHPGVSRSSATPYLFAPLTIAAVRNDFLVRRFANPQTGAAI